MIGDLLNLEIAHLHASEMVRRRVVRSPTRMDIESILPGFAQSINQFRPYVLLFD